MNTQKSQDLFARACQVIPGGVNSPVRACGSVGSTPCLIQRGEGPYIFDADNNKFIDYVGSWGPLILGHNHPSVVMAATKALKNGATFGAPTKLEIQLAEAVVKAVESVEMVRMVNSGTEATMSAIRLSRAATKKDGIIKFDGCYHGHADNLLVAAGSGIATLGIPGSPGVPEAVANSTISLEFNNLEKISAVIQEKGEDIAAIIIEPVAGNMGVVPPEPEFLEGLRKIADENNIILIFDEVMTGFRIAMGGAQSVFKIRPDLTCLGKIIGGGLPVGAYGGKKSLMEQIAPQGPVYQAGTLSGNPVAMAAGKATLEQLAAPGFYEDLEKKSDQLAKGLKHAVEKSGAMATVSRAGSMLTLFFNPKPVKNFADAKKCDLQKFAHFYNGMLKQGVYLPPSQFEAWFVSAAHTSVEIDATIEAAERVLAKI